MSFKTGRNRASFLHILVVEGKELRGEEPKNFFPIYTNLAFTVAENPMSGAASGTPAGRVQPATAQGKFTKSAAEPAGCGHGPVTLGVLWV